MGCSLRESIPVVLIERQHRGNQRAAVIVGEGRAFFPQPSEVWRRIGAGGRGGSRAGQASFVAVSCRQRGVVVRGRVTHRTPALPHPWPGWAAVSVGNSLPPGQPSGPTLQLSNSQAASRRRCCVASAPQPQARLAPGFNGSGSATAFFFASPPPKHTRPALLPLAVERPLESRLERKGSMLFRPSASRKRQPTRQSCFADAVGACWLPRTPCATCQRGQCPACLWLAVRR